MPALDVPPRHSTLGRVITGLMAFTVLWGLFVGVHPQPSPRVQMVMLLAMALLTVAALWLRRRDRCAYERRLAREAAARAVVEDRLVIARELHDAVSGNLGAITVRCAVARRLETAPDGLRRALDDVEIPDSEAVAGVWASQRMDPALLRTGVVAPEVEWAEAMAALAVPALLVTGDRPGAARVGPEGLEVVKRIANPEVTTALVPGAAHDVRRTRPESFYDVVDPWLAGVLRPRESERGPADGA